jgi:hypothetical protein
MKIYSAEFVKSAMWPGTTNQASVSLEDPVILYGLISPLSDNP